MSVKPFVVCKVTDGGNLEIQNWQEFDMLNEAQRFLKDFGYEPVKYFQSKNYWLYIHDSMVLLLFTYDQKGEIKEKSFSTDSIAIARFYSPSSFSYLSFQGNRF